MLSSKEQSVLQSKSGGTLPPTVNLEQPEHHGFAKPLELENLGAPPLPLDGIKRAQAVPAPERAMLTDEQFAALSRLVAQLNVTMQHLRERIYFEPFVAGLSLVALAPPTQVNSSKVFVDTLIALAPVTLVLAEMNGAPPLFSVALTAGQTLTNLALPFSSLFASSQAGSGEVVIAGRIRW